MAIQAISFGNNAQVTPAATNEKPKKKIGTVGKGALIGAGVGATLQTVSYFGNPATKDVVKMLGKGVYGACIAFGIATYALIGAGIGKLVKNHQEAKQMEKEADERDAKKVDAQA